MPTLSTEIVEAIVDYLADDFKGLRACALASRVFLSRSRHLRFHTITMTRSADAEYFKNLMLLTAEGSRPPEVFGMVQNLILQQELPPVNHYPDWLVGPQTVFSIIELFARARSITLSGLRWDSLDSIAQFNMYTFPNLTHVRILGCNFYHFSTLQALLSVTPQSTNLVLENTAYMHGDEPLAGVPKVRPERFHITHLPHDTPQLLHALVCDRMLEASFAPRSLDAMCLISGICKSSAARLEYLHIHPVFQQCSTKPLVTSSDLSLEHNTGLQQLVITGITIRDPFDPLMDLHASGTQNDDSVMFWLADILESTTSSMLQQVDYQINAGSLAAVFQVNWARIERAITSQRQHNSACLQGIDVHLLLPWESRGSITADSFARLSVNGSIRFHTGYKSEPSDELMTLSKWNGTRTETFPQMEIPIPSIRKRWSLL